MNPVGTPCSTMSTVGTKDINMCPVGTPCSTMSTVGTKDINMPLSSATTWPQSIARGVSPWNASHSFNPAATRRHSIYGGTNASIFWKPVFPSHLQYQKSRAVHRRRNATETLRIFGGNTSESKGPIGCGWRHRRPCAFARFTLATSIHFGHAPRPKEQLIGMDPRDFSRPKILCVAVGLWRIFSKFLGPRFGSKVFGESERTSRKANISRGIRRLSQIARFGIRRAIYLGLR